jgi:ribosomal-protein-alanine N-acetyltransferase
VSERGTAGAAGAGLGAGLAGAGAGTAGAWGLSLVAALLAAALLDGGGSPLRVSSLFAQAPALARTSPTSPMQVIRRIMMVTMTRGRRRRNAWIRAEIRANEARNREPGAVVEGPLHALHRAGSTRADVVIRSAMVGFPELSPVSPPELSTERLRLWVAGPEDAAELLRHHAENREHLGRWAPPAPSDVYTLAYWQARAATSRRDVVEGRAVRLAVAWQGSPDRIIGTCSFTEIVRGPVQACQLGYGLDQHEQGKGVMTEALGAAIGFAFGPLKLHRITASYMPSNTRSGRLLERLGFVVEGCARAHLFIRGAWRDHVLAALINPAPVVPAL